MDRRIFGIGLAAGAAACATNASVGAVLQLDQRLTPIARFVGCWRGVAEGEPGQGTVERSYVSVLGGKFIEERNQSRYASGEIHHHIAYWSLDRGRMRFMLRQFHEESFVNQFMATTPDFVGDRLVMESEAIENIPAGFRARETYVFNGADAFEEIFEIGEPNAQFQLYSHNRFTRV